MPTYVYRCPACGDYDVWQSIHEDTLSECVFCERQILKVLSPPNIAAAALGEKGASVVSIDKTEARWDRDMPAYRRFRLKGIQPRAIDGCDELEARAQTRFEIETGITVANEEKVHEGMGLAREMGLNAT